MSGMVAYALPRHRDAPRATPRLRFTLRSLLIGMACFGALLAVYRVGYWHGIADEAKMRRTTDELQTRLGILETWWFAEHPGEPLPDRVNLDHWKTSAGESAH
jgi:hypothetical protein